MVNRVNQWPILLFTGRIAEASANTYAEIALRMYQSMIASKGKVSGIEICRIVSSIVGPDAEAGETNQVNAQITKESRSNFLGIHQEQSIYVRRVMSGSAGDVATNVFERTQYDDLTCDGKGMIVWDKKLFAGIAGVGNSNTKVFQFAAYGYLVEGTALEVVGQMQDDAA